MYETLGTRPDIAYAAFGPQSLRPQFHRPALLDRQTCAPMLAVNVLISARPSGGRGLKNLKAPLTLTMLGTVILADQPTVALSSCEAEHYGKPTPAKSQCDSGNSTETSPSWVTPKGQRQSPATTKSAIALTNDPEHRSWTKHIAVRYQWIRDKTFGTDQLHGTPGRPGSAGR